MRFSDELRRAADDIWKVQHEHPFVRGLGEGTLDPERFRFYIRQDYGASASAARCVSLEPSG